MISQIVGFKDRFLIPYNGLKVSWFDNWHPSLDEVLQSLPEIETCPHELFRLLFKNPGSAPKKIALITEQKTPVAIVPLRRLGRLYYEVSTWMIPGAVFPVKPGYLMRALEALKIEVWVTWRRMGVLPPPSPLVRYLQAVPVHIIRLKDDYEQYWRATGQLKHIRKVRNRCKNFEYVINSPDSAEWIIRNAAEKWRKDPAGSNRVLDDWVVSDWILAAKYWENKGRHYTILLLDHGIPIGGVTLMVDNNDAVGGLIYLLCGRIWSKNLGSRWKC
jgi:hypothetical protein